MSFKFPQRLILLSSVTASNSASIAFTSLISANFPTYYVTFVDLLPATDIVNLLFTASVDNGANYLATNYKWALENVTSSANAITGSTSDSSGMIASNLSNTSSRGLCGDYFFFQLNTTNQIVGNGTGCHYNKDARFAFYQSTVANTGTTAVNAIKFAMSSGNITSGTINLFGVVEP